jgi:hypothetical protein
MPKCKARRTNGEECRQFAIRGGEVCATHGGRAPQVRKRAAERVALAKFERRRYGGPAPRDVSPHDAVLGELSWSSVHTEWLREQVAAEDGAQHVDEYGKERDRLVQIAKTAHSMGIEERQIALAEAHGAALILLINRVAQHPDIPVSTRPVLRRVFAAELRALGPGGTDGA